METLATLGLIALIMMGMTLVIVSLLAFPLCESREEIKKILRLIGWMLFSEATFPVSFPLLAIWGVMRWYYNKPEKVDPNRKMYYWF